MDETVLNGSAMADTSMDDTVMNDAMDDLFGEAADTLDLTSAVGLPTVSIPPPPALVRRLAEMQTNGCCNKLAWSNTGSIAQISPDGSKITFRSYARSNKTGQWVLSNTNSHPISAPVGSTFVHLHFNQLGQELIVLDNYGNPKLFGVSGGNGRMQEIRLDAQQEDPQTDELDAIIGVYWLPTFPLDCRAMYIGPASRATPTWTSESKPRDPKSVKVHHPVENGRAFLLVSRNGQLVLYYQQDGWQRTTRPIVSFESSLDLLTHADICEHNEQLLLIVRDQRKDLTLYQININWNQTSPLVPTQPPTITIDPDLQITQIASIHDPLPQQAMGCPLTHLLLVPSTAEVIDQTKATLPTIVATFVRTPLQSAVGGQYQDSATILARWDVLSQVAILHDSFKSLKPNNNALSPSINVTRLQRRPDIMIPRIVLSICSRYFDSVLLLTSSDATVEFRDRSSFETLESYMDADHVSSLPQTGFGYLSGDHVVQAATSYDASAMVVVKPDSTLDALTMSFRYGWPDPIQDVETNPLAEAAIVCLAREYMIMVLGSISPDEVLALLPSTLPVDLEHLFYREIFRLARHGPDISPLDEKIRQNLVLREPLLPRAYGVQLFLGSRPGRVERSMTAQHAWAVLNLRHVCQAISQVTGRLDPVQPFPSELVHSLRGHAKWAIDFFVSIAHTLLSVKELAAKQPDKPAIQVVQEFMSVSNSPAFMLVLCSFPRTLLKILVQFAPRLIKLSQVSVPRARTVLERQQLTEVGLLEKMVPFKFEAFKTFLEQVESAVNSSFIIQASGAPRVDRSRTPDVVMTLTGRIPDELEQTLKALLVTAIPALLEHADTTKIFFSNTSWLGLNGNKSVELARTYDVLKKTPLPLDAVLRHCRRCGSSMEDINTERPRELPQWLVGTQRFCVCTCTWTAP